MKYLFIIYILNIYLVLIFSYIKIPFKTLNTDKVNKLNQLMNNYIYIEFNLDLNNNNNNTKKILLKQEKYDFFLYNKSSTYKNTKKYEIIEIKNSLCKKGALIKDNIYLSQNIFLNNISFILCNQYYNDENLIIDGQLGLGLGYEDYSYDTNFIRQIKNKNIINNYIYSIIYESNDTGFLLLGEYPHILNKENLNLNWFHAVKNEKKQKWCINFDKISYSNSDLFQIQREGVISIENKFIISPYQYFNLIKDIFGKKCHNYEFEYNYQFLSCDKDINKEFIPEIKFFNKELDMIFILDYNDLFYDTENSLHFLVATYADIDEGYWILGKPFLKKYLFIYNTDTKMIGVYNNNNKNIDNNNNNKIKNNKNNFNTSIFLNILLGIIIIILIFVLYHCYINKRRIRANELEDKFNYIAKNDNEINNL